jgi:hypothetical protein
MPETPLFGELLAVATVDPEFALFVAALVAVPDEDPDELQTVLSVPIRLAPCAAVIPPRARPCVTFWKFSLTSPMGDEMRRPLCGAPAL